MELKEGSLCGSLAEICRETSSNYREYGSVGAINAMVSEGRILGDGDKPFIGKAQ